MSTMNEGLAQAKANKNAAQNTANMNEINRKLGLMMVMLEELLEKKCAKKSTSKKSISKKSESE